MSCGDKHQKRLIRMLSKYGDVKKDHLPTKRENADKQVCSDSSSNHSLKSATKRPSNASTDYQNGGSDQVDCAITTPDSINNDYPTVNEPTIGFRSAIQTELSPPALIQENYLLRANRSISEPESHHTTSDDVCGTYFDTKPFDFFSSDIESEKSTKPYIFINSFRQHEVPLIPANFYHRKSDGFLLRWTGFKCLKNLLDNKSDRHRPIFTYSLMLLEIVICILILSIYGYGYFGFSKKNVSDIVWHQSNSYQPATYSEPCNMWLGPSPSILIREGALFSPCMKQEKSIYDSIQRRVEQEKETGCCIRLDNSGCVQTPQSKCSKRTSVWVKSKGKPGPVCGQDPKYCLDSSSKHWPANITDWPVCKRNNRTLILTSNGDSHMKCKVQARPCCSGIYGKCILTSKEYCEFIKGKYHPKATLCSQVNCLNDVCGLIPFEKEPNQMYRLILSLFLHAGIFQLLITIFLQYRFMAVFEETYGTRKILFVYLVSGAGGNLASALFLPSTPEIGPMGSFFGILSLLLYEIYINWDLLDNPCITFFKVSCFLPVLFFLGLFLPWINNFSNTFGFIFGFLTIFLILPDNHWKGDQRRARIFTRLMAAFLLCLLFGSLLFLFYHSHYVEPYLQHFQYLNCIPITDTWCSSLDTAIKEIKALN